MLSGRVMRICISYRFTDYKDLCNLCDMIIKGPYPDVEIPETALTPLVLRRVNELPDKPALMDGPSGRTITYSQLADSIAIVAYKLEQRGFKKGEVFRSLSPNCPDHVVIFDAVGRTARRDGSINQPAVDAKLDHASAQRRLRTVPGNHPHVHAESAGSRRGNGHRKTVRVW